MTQKKKKKRILYWSVLSVILITSIVILIAILFFYVRYGAMISEYQGYAEKVVSESGLEDFRQAETSLVYDENQILISTLKGEKDVYYLDYQEIPTDVIKAMIAIEDKKYMEHEGIDLVANIRVLLGLIRNKGETSAGGGSTITQQLARNIFLSHTVSLERKLKEIFIAIEIEKKYDKHLIMEFYLNNIYFANGAYGIQAASKYYFSKEVVELSLAEIAFLCAIPNNPTLYDPYENYDNTIGRKNRILDQMRKEGYITESEYETAINEEVILLHTSLSKNDYVETYVYYCATRALMEVKGFEFQSLFETEEEEEAYTTAYQELYMECQKSLYYEGYRIYTSIDLEKQQLLQQTVDDTLKGYEEVTEDGIYTLQGAAVSIDNETGRVVAIVGGRSQETIGYTFNRGYQSYRQPGSAIKPLIVYTPIFERNYYPEDLVYDEAFEGGPSNADGTYMGEISIRTAVEQSRNTIAWKLFQELTPSVGLTYLLDMNFSKIDENDYYPASSLGGFTTGVSPLELTAGYVTLVNDGIYRDPSCIIHIQDSEGNVIYRNTGNEKYIYTANATRMMTDVLKGVMTEGTGKSLALNQMPSAGKTGTTSKKKDGWFVGFTTYYTTGVWVGYDIPKELEGLSGSSYPGNIWKTYMNTIHEGLEVMDFIPYTDNRPKTEIEDNLEESEEDIEDGIENQEGDIGELENDDPEIEGVDFEIEVESGENSLEDIVEDNPDSEMGEWFENTEDDFYEETPVTEPTNPPLEDSPSTQEGDSDDLDVWSEDTTIWE